MGKADSSANENYFININFIVCLVGGFGFNLRFLINSFGSINAYRCGMLKSDLHETKTKKRI